jgi:hypothetical protein
MIVRTRPVTVRAEVARSPDTVGANVPAPQHPLCLGGRRLLEDFPFVPRGASEERMSRTDVAGAAGG